MQNRYSTAELKKIGSVMHEFKEGTLKSSSGETVTDRKQAVAIGISEAREAHLKVPEQNKRD